MPQIPESPDVGDDERDAELIFRTDLPEVDTAIFHSQAAATAVVTELNDLVLQSFVLEIVADTGNEIKALARFAAVAYKRANLARKRLLERGETGRQRNGEIALCGIVIQPEVSSRGKEFPERPYFQERADGDQSLNLRIVLKNLLQIVRAARSNLKIADDRRPVARAERESERRDGIQRLENVALPVNDGAAKSGIKVVLLGDAPGNEFLRLVVAIFAEEPLRYPIFDFAGVGERGIRIEMHEVSKAIHAGNVAVGESGFDGVLVPVASLLFFQGGAVEEPF